MVPESQCPRWEYEGMMVEKAESLILNNKKRKRSNSKQDSLFIPQIPSKVTSLFQQGHTFKPFNQKIGTKYSNILVYGGYSHSKHHKCPGFDTNFAVEHILKFRVSLPTFSSVNFMYSCSYKILFVILYPSEREYYTEVPKCVIKSVFSKEATLTPDVSEEGRVRKKNSGAARRYLT